MVDKVTKVTQKKKSVTKEVDWVSIEVDWRAGIKTKLQISNEHGVSRAAMDKHFAKIGVTRDLSAQIRARAEEKVTRSVTPSPTAGKEEEIIEKNADLQATVILTHRKDIQRYRLLCSQLLDEIEISSNNKELFDELGFMLRNEDDRGNDKRNDIYMKAISMSGRIDGMKKLAEVLKILIGLERQAFGLSDTAEGDKPSKDPSDINPTEAARKIAFALQLGMQQAAMGNKAP